MTSPSALVSAILLLTCLLQTGADIELKQITLLPCKPWERPARSPGPDILNLNFYGCNLTQIRPEDLNYNLPNLELIWLNKNQLTRVDLAVFKPFPTLNVLVLAENKLAKPPIFNDTTLIPNLIKLYMHKNLITEIPEDSFSGLVKLQKLFLSDNLIEYIHLDAFKPMTELNKLLLDNNKISYISDDMFVNNKKLGWLSLEYNHISYLPLNFVASFRSGAGLHTLSFGNNPWQCSCLRELLVEVMREGVQKGSKYGYEDEFKGKPAVCWYSGNPCHRGVGALSAQ